jgi:hypothetical protein
MNYIRKVCQILGTSIEMLGTSIEILGTSIYLDFGLIQTLNSKLFSIKAPLKSNKIIKSFNIITIS